MIKCVLSWVLWVMRDVLRSFCKCVTNAQVIMKKSWKSINHINQRFKQLRCEVCVLGYGFERVNRSATFKSYLVFLCVLCAFFVNFVVKKIMIIN